MTEAELVQKLRQHDRPGLELAATRIEATDIEQLPDQSRQLLSL